MPPAESTLKAYSGRIRALVSHFKCLNIELDLSESESVINGLKLLMIDNPETLKGYLSAILFETKTKYPDAYAEYHNFFNEIKSICSEKAKDQKLPDTRANQMLSWDEVLRTREKARLLFEETPTEANYNKYLVICLYTYQAPLRADYCKMRISHSDISPESFIGGDSNYLLLPQITAKSSFVFKIYKTAKTYGKQVIQTDDTVAQLIKEYGIKTFKRCLSVLPESWSPNYLSDYVSKVFLELSGKACGIGLLRHSYICYFYDANPSIRQKEDLARRMLHSIKVQELYRCVRVGLFPEEKSVPVIDVSNSHSVIQEAPDSEGANTCDS